MPASLSKQIAAMDSLAWRITYEWNKAKNKQKTIGQMGKVWQDIQQTGHYQCLADKRKESVHYLWNHVRQQTLACNQVHGRWLNGQFYANWCDLPENVKYNDSLLRLLPTGHFWLKDGEPTIVRYFISEDSKGENRDHFALPVA